MADKEAKCEQCGETFPIRLMRYVKIDDVFKYLCNTCRGNRRSAQV